MNRKNLIIGALFTAILIVGVAVWGEHTHFVPPPKAIRLVDPAPPPFPVDTEKPPPEPSDEKPKPENPIIDIPRQQENIPIAPPPDAFREKIEPPPPPGLRDLGKITNDGPATDLSSRIFDPSQLGQQPVAKSQVRPVYPGDMRQAGIAGEVLVDFVVDPNGDVRNAFAVHSTEHDFEDAACRAVGRWKFRPGRKDGHAVYVHMQVPIVFSLNEGDGS